MINFGILLKIGQFVYCTPEQRLSLLSWIPDSFLKNIYLFLVVLVLSCSSWASLYSCGMCGLSRPVVCGILFPQIGIKPASPELQGRFLATRPAGKSHECQILDLVRGSQTFFCRLYTQNILSSLKTLKTFSMGDISNNICYIRN